MFRFCEYKVFKIDTINGFYPCFCDFLSFIHKYTLACSGKEINQMVGKSMYIAKFCTQDTISV